MVQWIQVVYFHQPGCPACEVVEQWLVLLQENLGNITIRKLNARTESSLRLHQALSLRFAVPERLHLVVPAVFTARGALIGEQITFESLARLLVESAGIPMEEGVESANAAETADAIFERFRRFTLPAILIFGLWDGLNPCAFATMIFFISYLQMRRRPQREMWLAGLTFIAAVYATYFLFGAGLAEALARFDFLPWLRRVFNGLMGMLALVIGVFNFRDARLSSGGVIEKSTLQLPESFRERIHRVVRHEIGRRKIALGSFAAGVAVSVVEFACTGQTYLPTIAYVIKAGANHLSALRWLAVYNAMFVLPLFVLMVMGIQGLRHPRATAWMRQHATLVKFGTACICFLIGAFLLKDLIVMGRVAVQRYMGRG